MPLTDTAIRSAKPQAKSVKMFDGGGLYLEVSPAGGKWWRWKYRFAGKEKRLSLGVYPDVKLKAARAKRDASRQQLAAGIDPGEARKAEKQSQAGAESFEARSRASGTASFRHAGRPVTVSASCGVSKGMSSHGSASGRLPRSKRPSCWPCCAGLRAGAHWKPPTAPSRTEGRCFATQ